MTATTAIRPMRGPLRKREWEQSDLDLLSSLCDAGLAPSAPLPLTASRNGSVRKHWTQFTLAAAIEALR